MSAEIVITACHSNSRGKTCTFNFLRVDHINCACQACSLSVTSMYTKNCSWDSLAPLKIVNPVQSHHLGLFRGLIGVTSEKLEESIDLLEGCFSVVGFFFFFNLVRVPEFKRCISTLSLTMVEILQMRPFTL